MNSTSRWKMRENAYRLLELVNSERNCSIVSRYKRINSLNLEYPPVAFHVPDAARETLFGNDVIESRIRRHEILRADMPLSATIYSGLIVRRTEWSTKYHTVRAQNDGSTSCFKPCINVYSDLGRLRFPAIEVDKKASIEHYEKLSDAVGDILDIRYGSPFLMTCGWGESMIDQLAEMRGLNQLFYDMLDAPEFVHEAMEFLTKGKINLLESYREQGILTCNHQGDFTIGSCSYPCTDELPDADGYKEESLWGFAQAQEFSGVSNEMLAEFVLPYQARIANRFGLLSYGCCEPMDKQIDLLAETFPNLRILAISPYSNIDTAVKKCRGRFVMNCKIHPSIVSNFDEQIARNYLETLVRKLRGCSATISFSEILDFGKDASVFSRLVSMAKEIVESTWSEISTDEAV